MPNLTAYEDGAKSAVALAIRIDKADRTADLYAAQVAALVLSDELALARELAYRWDETRSEADSLTEQRRRVMGDWKASSATHKRRGWDDPLPTYRPGHAGLLPAHGSARRQTVHAATGAQVRTYRITGCQAREGRWGSH
jgi:hypothetical protein